MRYCILFFSILVFSSCATPLLITKGNIELYRIEVDQKVGYIDQKGKIRIEPQYETCIEFETPIECTYEFNSETFAIVKLNGKYGLINWKGKVVLPFLFEELDEASDSSFVAKLNGKYGIIDAFGDTLVPYIFDSRYFLSYSRKVFPGLIDNKSVVYNTNTGLITKTDYDYIAPFINGYASVKKNGKEGLLNKRLELIIDTVYQKTGYFYSGLINVKLDNTWRFVNNKNQTVFNEVYEEASHFDDGVAAVKKGKYGVIDTLGNAIIPFEYEYLSYEGENDNGEKVFLFCNQEDYFSYGAKCGLINFKGDTILNQEYSEIFYFFDIVEAVRGRNGNAGVIDLMSKKVVIPFNFDETEYYDDGLISLYFSDNDGNEFFGYVNQKNKIIWSNNKKLLEEKLKPEADDEYYLWQQKR